MYSTLPTESDKKNKLENNLLFVGILEVTDEQDPEQEQDPDP
jgi:hypothetical protein